MAVGTPPGNAMTGPKLAEHLAQQHKCSVAAATAWLSQRRCAFSGEKIIDCKYIRYFCIMQLPSGQYGFVWTQVLNQAINRGARQVPLSNTGAKTFFSSQLQGNRKGNGRGRSQKRPATIRRTRGHHLPHS